MLREDLQINCVWIVCEKKVAIIKIVCYKMYTNENKLHKIITLIKLGHKLEFLALIFKFWPTKHDESPFRKLCHSSLYPETKIQDSYINQKIIRSQDKP